MIISASQAAEALIATSDIHDGHWPWHLDIAAGRLAIRLMSNNAAFVEELKRYFAHVLLDAVDPDITVIAIEATPTDLGLSFTDWAREPGKKGRKDAIADLRDGRLVQKIRTGMVFLQSPHALIAHGPCIANPNQVINFLNAQYMNHLQQHGALISHASGLVKNGQCLAMAGLSGGGKSTLMLKLLADDGSAYLTNDRLFLKRDGDQMMALGIPKLPRINPGTILHDPILRPMLPDDRQAELRAMPREDLWALEEKYDVDVAALYGADAIVEEAPLGGLLVLNWSHDSDETCHIAITTAEERPDLLPAVMKSPGPFYQFKDGKFYQDDMTENPGDWTKALTGIPVLEVTGKIDFDAAVAAVHAWQAES